MSFKYSLKDNILNKISSTLLIPLQSPLSLFLQDSNDMNSTLRKALQQTNQQNTINNNNNSSNNNSNNNSPSNNNNLVSINQQLSNLGTINQQLTTLSQQLSTLNHHNNNLQNYQQLGLAGTSSLQQHQQLQQQQQQTSTAPTINQLQNIKNDMISQQELYQLNQDLLNRLQNLNFGFSHQQQQQTVTNNSSNINNNSYLYTNPSAQFGISCGNLSSNPQQQPQHNLLNSPSNLLNNLQPTSSMGGSIGAGIGGLGGVSGNAMGSGIVGGGGGIGSIQLNRNSYSASTLDDSIGLSYDKNLDNMDNIMDNNNLGHLIKPLSQVGTLTTLDADGKVKVIVPISSTNYNSYNNSNSILDFGSGGSILNTSSTSSGPSCSQELYSSGTTPIMKRNEKKVQLPPNVVTLKVTDESGNVTRKLPATPSFITRSTSEKVPNRSQIMSQVQRTQWARHTTK